MKLYLIYFVYITLVYCSTPDYFPQCKRSDPEIEKCILEGIEFIKPKLKDGIPEINLPPLDPLKMDQLDINSYITGATVKATMKNIVARGGSQFIITYLRIDLNNAYAAELKIKFPRLEVSAEYNTLGSKLLLTNIHETGKFSGTFADVEVHVKGSASPITRQEVEYLQLDSLKTHVTIGKVDVDIKPTENSFTGRAASSFVGWNPSLMLSILSPVIDDTAAPIVKQYVDDVLANVPIKDILVDEW